MKALEKYSIRIDDRKKNNQNLINKTRQKSEEDEGFVQYTNLYLFGTFKMLSMHWSYQSIEFKIVGKHSLKSFLRCQEKLKLSFIVIIVKFLELSYYNPVQPLM